MTPAPVEMSVNVDPEQVRECLERVCGSKHFRESAQLREFLTFVVEETLAGRASGLKEYQLGLSVFRRGREYDPRKDAIVRVQASVLRKRLAAYFAEAGEPLVIDLPRGSYVPEFRTAEPAAASPEPVSSRPIARPWLPFLLGVALTAFAAALIGWGLWPRSNAVRITSGSVTDLPQVWSAFDPDTPAVVSFGVPLFYAAGGGIFFRDTQSNRVNGPYSGKLAETARALNLQFYPQADVYTGIGDAQGTHRIVTYLAENGVPARLENARQLVNSDWQDGNLVIVSSLRFQTPLDAWKLPAELTFDEQDSGSIVVVHPGPGEPRRYETRSTESATTTYALVSLWPALQPGRRVLTVSGIHTWATEGAADFLTEPASAKLLASKLNPAESAFFQVLLRVEGQGNRARSTEYLLHRFVKIPDAPLAR